MGTRTSRSQDKIRGRALELALKMIAATVCLLGALLAAGCAAGPKPPTTTMFYPKLPETPRLQYLTTINNEQDIGAKSGGFKDFVVGDTTGPISLVRPWDVAHEKGKLYVLDRGLGQVVIVDLVNHRFDFFDPGVAEVLSDPFGIFVAGDGVKYVADRERGQVLVFDQQNRFQRSYDGDGEMAPLDVVVRGDRVYVCDVHGQGVTLLDKESGTSLGWIGREGKREASLYWPTHLAISLEGTLIVSDLQAFHVQVYDATGEYLRTIGEQGDYPGAMPRPKGVAVDREGHLYVVDAAFELVQIFDTESGQVLMPFSRTGMGPGESWLPAGVHVDYENLEYFQQYVDRDFRARYLVYVTNQAGPNKLNVYAFGEYVGTGNQLGSGPERGEGSTGG